MGIRCLSLKLPKVATVAVKSLAVKLLHGLVRGKGGLWILLVSFSRCYTFALFLLQAVVVLSCASFALPVRVEGLFGSVVNRHWVSHAQLIVPTSSSERSICPKWYAVIMGLEGEGRVWNFETMGTIIREAASRSIWVSIAEIASDLHRFLLA